MNVPNKVNKQQFFFLAYHFMLENRIHQDWFIESKKDKAGCTDPVTSIVFSEDDDFKTRLMKSIEVYIANVNKYNIYSGKIYGLFRFIPACFNYDFHDYSGSLSKWGNISEKWEAKYKQTDYIEE